MRLQTMRSDGTWATVAEEHTEWYITRAVEISTWQHTYNPEEFPVWLDRAGVLDTLQRGWKLRTGQDWHEQIRRTPQEGT